jgi:hypothetical protein
MQLSIAVRLKLRRALSVCRDGPLLVEGGRGKLLGPLSLGLDGQGQCQLNHILSVIILKVSQELLLKRSSFSIYTLERSDLLCVITHDVDGGALPFRPYRTTHDTRSTSSLDLLDI